MQDKKYIPIIAAALVILLVAALAYLLFSQKKQIAETEMAAEVARATLEALALPGEGARATEQQLREVFGGLATPGVGGVSEEEAKKTLELLDQPAN